MMCVFKNKTRWDLRASPLFPHFLPSLPSSSAHLIYMEEQQSGLSPKQQRPPLSFHHVTTQGGSEK